MKAVILSLLIFTNTIAFAEQPLRAGVSKIWSIDLARQEAFLNLQPKLNTSGFSQVDPYLLENRKAIQNHLAEFGNRHITVFSDGSYAYSELCSPIAYYYHSNGRLYGFDVNSSSSFNGASCPSAPYPHKSYKYLYPSGQVDLISLIIKPDESYSFNLNGSLFDHWIGSKCYNFDGSSCGTRQSFRN